VAPGDQPPTATATPDPNTLVWALSAPVTTLDAARLAVDPSGTQVAAQIYDRLMVFRPGTADLAPGAAEDWFVDASSRTYSFVLRQGLTFHDGTPLDAPAVAWNFERWMNPEHPQHRDDFRTWLALFGGFVGQRDTAGRPMNLVAKVEVLDARTVRFTLREPFAPFLNHLAMVPFGLASPAAVRTQGSRYGTDGGHLPVGSGPFRAVGWARDGTVRLVTFADYRGGRPAVPELRFVVVPDVDKRVELIGSGAVHGAELPPTTPITGTLASPELKVTARPPRANSWLMLNHARSPLDDVRVRRAILLAVDRERLARDHFGPFALPANQLLPPGFVGYHDALPPPIHDPEAARELLAEAGVPGGFRLIIWAPNAPRDYLPDPVNTAESIARMLREVNIDASVRSKSLRQFLSDRDSGRYTAWLIGWEAQSADPDNLWFWHFGAGRSAAEGQYYNLELGETLLQAQRTVGGPARSELYRLAAKTVIADAARAFLVHARTLVVLSPRVRGYQANTLGFDDLSTVTLIAAPTGATAVPIPTSARSPATPVSGAPDEAGDPEGTGAAPDEADGTNEVDEAGGTNEADEADATATAEATRARDATAAAAGTEPEPGAPPLPAAGPTAGPPRSTAPRTGGP